MIVIVFRLLFIFSHLLQENLKYIRRLRESDDSGVSQQSPGSKSRSDINEANKTLNQMSETTQDVAYRRKIIMDALIQSNETSLELLDNIMQDNEEEKSTRLIFFCKNILS